MYPVVSGKKSVLEIQKVCRQKSGTESKDSSSNIPKERLPEKHKHSQNKRWMHSGNLHQTQNTDSINLQKVLVHMVGLEVE